MKFLVVGSKSIHLSSFLEALTVHGLHPAFLAEESCNYSKEEYIISFRKTDPVSVAKSNLALRKLLKKLSPDFVHIHQVNRLGYFVSRQCAKLNIPLVTTAWGSDVLIIPQKNRFFRFLVRKTLERSQWITADSKEMISAMMRLHPSKDKYVHLQYGITLIDPGQKERIIYSNRLHQKLYRIDQIIAYMDEFRKENPDWKLIIGAVGRETDALKRNVEVRGMQDCVEFVGWLETKDNHAWYARASIYITIPEHDGTAISLLEAMSAGCIPIVPNLDVSREWIEDGVNGIIEKPGKNPLFEALVFDREACATANRDRIEKEASRAVCTGRFIEIYRTLGHV